MTRRTPVGPSKGQLELSLDEQAHPQVEYARALRRAAGLPDSLIAPELIVKVRAILEADRRPSEREPSRRLAS